MKDRDLLRSLLLVGLDEARSSVVRDVSEDADEREDVVEARSSSMASLEILTSFANVLFEMALAEMV